MALDIYDSQYLVILAPSLVIALIFLFFWLFMKETSYDEVLARQKRDLKLPPSKPDTRKKNDKKKSKKKESSSGGGGGGGGESEEDLRDFDMADAVSSSTAEEEEPTPMAPPTPVPVPVAAPAEAPVGVRERKKKEKKAAKAAAAPPAEEPEVNGSKPAGRKAEPPAPVAKPSPPSPQLDHQSQPPCQTQTPCQAQTPPQPSGKKKKEKKQKTESVEEEIKVEKAPAPVKKEAPVLVETKAQDGPSPPDTTTTSGKKRNSAKKQKTEHAPVDDVQADSATSANHNDDAPSKGSGKKQKNEANKENSEVKLKELLVGLGSLALSQAEAVSVVTVLKEKNPSALDAWQKSAVKTDPSSLERERLLTTLQEEASIAKDKVQQLSKELQQEKQKTVRAEAVLRDQRGAMEKELNVVQAKAQGELQGMQMKKLREQLEGQIARLQQENGILRDAVSSATNQMESKQSSELNQLRSEYSGLMKELAENNNKLQQEEHQRKSLEVNYKQNVSQLEAQLQDAKRGWEELQNYLHNVNAEREKLHAAKEELQSQLLAVETEMSNKNKEIQTLHSSLTDTIVSKDQVEQKVMQLLEVSQHSLAEDSVQVQDLLSEKSGLNAQIETLQAQLSSQATTVSHFEELQKLLAEKELQRKSLEDSLNSERSSGASRETNMQAMHNDNMSLKAALQNLQAQISEQTVSQLALDQFQKSVQEREEKIKTVEDLLKMGMIEVANKEEQLTLSLSQTVREENKALKREMEAFILQTTEQTSSDLIMEGLQSKIQEKDEQIMSMEESLQAAQASGSSNGMTIESLEQQVAGLQSDIEQLRQKQAVDTTSASDQLLELQTQLAAKDQEIQTLQSELESRAKEVSDKVQELQQKQTHTESPSLELLTALAEKEKQVSDLQGELAKLRESLELHRNKNNELRVKNWSAMEALAATESMLQGKLSKALKENQTALEIAQAECQGVLHRLLPNVPLPTERNHQEWLQRFETAVKEAPAAEPNSAPEAAPEPAPEGSEDTKVLADKLKESEEAQKVLQKDCETYKKVLAETEGILQRLQSSVEKEESRWKVKLDLSQTELKEMSVKVAALEQDVDRLSDVGELDNLIRDKQHLESALERAERESATYVTEVRELKTQLTETLSKLETEESERQKVAGDLYKAQQSLDLIQEEVCKETGQGDLIENSNLSSHEEIDRKEKKTAGLNQTVRELQQLLQAVNRQLTKRQEAESDKDSPEV
ncbi:kinectin isoform X2 [Oncorhynchus tshawytscha]|uniref:kinectin isoform X2 n=1 Tax=Oncorhynchus tshawytscha TaxID=74940 RepID=UPI000D0A43CF|nr:kinectin isoform X2 [Oncorhynchus tshawytscha]